MEFVPVRRTSLSAAVVEQLIAQILDGRLPAGTNLPPERTLTEEFGVNRQALREALQRLDQLGLVDIRHGDATRVRDYHRHAGLDLLPRLFTKGDGSVDREVVRSVMELRNAIGTDAAALCARRALPGEIAGLQSVVAELTATDPADVERLDLLDTRFWDLVIDGSDNVCYRLSLNTLVGAYQPFDSIVRQLMADERRDAEGHRAIVSAIAASDAEEARAAARRLLARGTAALTTFLAGRGSRR